MMTVTAGDNQRHLPLVLLHGDLWMSFTQPNFWRHNETELCALLNTNTSGITDAEAARRVMPATNDKSWVRDLLLLLSQYKSPLVLLLVIAAGTSAILGEYSDSVIVLVILLLTGLLGFVQERNAGKAVQQLCRMVHSKAFVKRDGAFVDVPIESVVPGDVIFIRAGDIIPADALILEANDLHVNESLLTGESFPAEKFQGTCSASTLAQVTNAVFKGTSVVNGTATVLAVNTGKHTEAGKIMAGLEKKGRETAFEKGVRQFGYLLTTITLFIGVIILTLNIALHKPVVDSLLFVLALAVGMSPELLPAILTVTLSAGARRLAARKVIVRKLSAVENLGEMDVLCVDKTGTLTEGVVQVTGTLGTTGGESEQVRKYAYLNAFFETGFFNPLDEAIRQMPGVDAEGYVKRDEVPFDFIRKRLSVVVSNGTRDTMITKGAVDNILQCCSWAQLPNGSVVAIGQVLTAIKDIFNLYSKQGFRTIAICYKDVTDDPVITKDDEGEMVFLGMLTLSDPPKAGIIDSLDRLRKTGIRLKMITGDNRLVAQQVAAQTGLASDRMLTGGDLHQLTTDVLVQRVEYTDLFAEIEPAQNERIIRACQQNGHAVGFMGDGINDANALHVADVGISIDNAVDVAKEAASLVLLEKNIDVLLDGIEEGRKTFVNTLKYIFVTTSANFGNMISMAVASIFLPFLPLLPIQVLLNNFLSDLPALTIAWDNVDKESLTKPRRWNMKTIRRYMVSFGLQSSLFDFLTFALLLFVFHASPAVFRTGWFTLSLLTEILILLVIRTKRPFIKSRPASVMLIAAAMVFCIALVFPYLPFAPQFAMVPLSPHLLMAIIGITCLYVLTSELTKRLLDRGHSTHY